MRNKYCVKCLPLSCTPFMGSSNSAACAPLAMRRLELLGEGRGSHDSQGSQLTGSRLNALDKEAQLKPGVMQLGHGLCLMHQASKLEAESAAAHLKSILN